MTYAVNEYRDLAQLVAQDDAGQWLDPGAPLPDGYLWERSEIAPAPGSERLVYVSCFRRASLAVGAERWTLFVPGMASLDGWEDHPEAIARSAFVKFRLRAAERADPDRQREWLRVEIIELIPFAGLDRLFTAQHRARLQTWDMGSSAELTRHGDWELWFAPHDDAGCWLIARVQGDAAHVVAGGEWLFGAGLCSDEAWAGHVVIPVPEWRRICRAR